MSTELKEWSVLSMLEWGTDYFQQKQVPDPRLSMEWLLAEILQLKRLDLYLKFDRPLSDAELGELRPLVKRRAQHEPLQYITGATDFMHAHIKVNPDVLIPRIETEQLVETVLDHYPSGPSLSVLDIGTGSGCIAIALKMERPTWELHALDLSDKALTLARENATENNAAIHWHQGDIRKWQQASLPSFNLIVSNPPYVLPSEKELLEPQVTAYEPGLALFCENIEEMYQSVIDCAVYHLTDEGTLYLEIHEQYADQICALFSEKRWKASLLYDYEKKPRFIVAQRQF